MNNWLSNVGIKLRKYFKGGVLYDWYGKLRSSKMVVTLLILGFGFYYLWELTFSAVDPGVKKVAIPATIGVFSALIGWFFKLRKDDKELITRNGGGIPYEYKEDICPVNEEIKEDGVDL